MRFNFASEYFLRQDRALRPAPIMTVVGAGVKDIKMTEQGDLCLVDLAVLFDRGVSRINAAPINVNTQLTILLDPSS